METVMTTEETKVETPVASTPAIEPAEASATSADAISAPVSMTAVKATAAQAKGVCDIVFLIDVTGSMQPAIDDLKSNIKNFFNSLSAADANGTAVVKDWRARVIGYRDVKADGSNWYIDNPFVRSTTQIEAQLDALNAAGGGDEPESLLDALYKVAKFGSTPKCAQTEDPTKWRYRSEASRVVVVFSDASFHPRTSLSEAPNLDWKEIANLAMQEKLRLSVYAPIMSCYDDLTQIDKCEYMPIEFDPTIPNDAIYKLREFTADRANFQRTLDQLAKTVSASAVAETL